MSAGSVPQSGSSFGLAALSLGLITLIGPAAIDMYLPFMPAMAKELGTDYTALQFSLTVFLVAMGAGQLVSGPVIDACGRRIPLIAALVVFGLASLLASLSQSLEALIFARLIQGLAASLAIVTAMSSVRDIAEGVRAAQLYAALMTVQGIGPVVSPAIGGVIGAAWGWRAVFDLLAVLAVIILLNTLVNMRETLPRENRSSLQPMAILRSYAEILSDGRFLLAGLSLAAVFAFLFSYISGASYAYQAGFGVSARDFGLIFGATGVAVLLGAMSSAQLVTRLQIEAVAIWGVAAILVGALVAALSALSGIGLPGIVAGMFIALAGLGVAEAVLMSIGLATRQTALGASAAVLGAGPLMAGAAMTPVAASLSERGAMPWLVFLIGTAAVATVLTLATARMVRKSGLNVSLQH